MRIMASVGAALLAGCAAQAQLPAAPEKPAKTSQDAIRYSTGACFGTCPVYSVTVRPDGSGTFDGQRFTAVTGRRAFTMSPSTYARFAAALQPYRPASGELVYAPGGTRCRRAPTDMPSVEVRWTSKADPDTRLAFYYGCASENRALADALRAAPRLLPIAELIGTPVDHRR